MTDDSNRPDIYAMEGRVFEGDPNIILKDVHDILGLSLRVLPSGMSIPTIKIDGSHRHKAAGFSPSRNRIVFSPGSLKYYIAIHEIAHWADYQMAQNADHGKSWQSVYLHLVHHIRGREHADLLRAGFRNL